MVSGTAYLVVVWLSSLILDRLFGELTRWHPLVGFGNAAHRVEFYLNSASGGRALRFVGVLAWSLLVLPPVLLIWALRQYIEQFSLPILTLLIDALVLYWAIGWRSLCEHIRAVNMALAEGNIVDARLRISYLVSRDSAELEVEEILCAGLETTLENSSDALFASLFWFAVAGPAGVVLHRLSNTLDAMWGYKNSRYYYYGWWAARGDDILNFVPAQLSALGFSILALSARGFRCWFEQGWRWKSINAGSVMASGAASLNITLGGAASYHGQTLARPVLGCGSRPKIADLERSISLINRQLFLWLAVVVVAGIFI